MPSITTWSRLEPNVRGATQPETLKARIYDPLWLLARQWQLGELQGEDNGTPVSARLRAECAELTRYVPQGGAARPVKFDPKRVPLETFVEREAVHPKPGALVRLRVSVEAGQQFLRVLGGAPFGTKYHQGFLEAFPLPPRSAALAADVDGLFTIRHQPHEAIQQHGSRRRLEADDVAKAGPRLRRQIYHANHVT